jgi:hypothetical protein
MVATAALLTNISAGGYMNSLELDKPTTAGSTPESGRFSASDCVLAALERVVESGRTAKVTVPSAGSVWIDAPRRQYWSRIEAEAPFFLAPAAQASIEWLPVVDDVGPPAPLEDLLWTAGWVGSGGALLDRCQPYDVVELRYWPNFTRLPHADSLFPLCSLLSHRPSSLSFAYRMLRLPEADAYRFYSAAIAAGLVRVVSAQPARNKSESSLEESPATAGQQGVGAFWGRLFKRISGL